MASFLVRCMISFHTFIASSSMRSLRQIWTS
jgi:hypothetical protein